MRTQTPPKKPPVPKTATKTPAQGFSLSDPFGAPAAELLKLPRPGVEQEFLKKPKPFKGPKLRTIGEAEPKFEAKTIEGFQSQDKPELLFLNPDVRGETRTMRPTLIAWPAITY